MGTRPGQYVGEEGLIDTKYTARLENVCKCENTKPEDPGNKQLRGERGDAPGFRLCFKIGQEEQEYDQPSIADATSLLGFDVKENNSECSEDPQHLNRLRPASDYRSACPSEGYPVYPVQGARYLKSQNLLPRPGPLYVPQRKLVECCAACQRAAVLPRRIGAIQSRHQT